MNTNTIETLIKIENQQLAYSIIKAANTYYYNVRMECHTLYNGTMAQLSAHREDAHSHWAELFNLLVNAHDLTENQQMTILQDIRDYARKEWDNVRKIYQS